MSDRPSPLKSPVPTACQLGPGLATLPPPITLVPFSSQMAISPLLFCHRISERPSPLKSPVPTACQLGPGLPRLPPPMTLVPFISQRTTSPLSFCHRTSDLPSPLKSLLVITLSPWATIPTAGTFRYAARGPNEQPFKHFSSRKRPNRVKTRRDAVFFQILLSRCLRRRFYFEPKGDCAQPSSAKQVLKGLREQARLHTEYVEAQKERRPEAPFQVRECRYSLDGVSAAPAHETEPSQPGTE